MRKLSATCLAFIVLLALIATHGALAKEKEAKKSETAPGDGHDATQDENDHGVGKPEMCRVEDFDALAEEEKKDRELLLPVVSWRQGCLGNPTNWYQIQTRKCYSRYCAKGRIHLCGTHTFCLNWSICHRYPTFVNGNYRIYTTHTGHYRRDPEGHYFVYCSNIRPPAYLADNGRFYFYNCIPG